MNNVISFFIGLLFGIMICVLLFYFDVKIFESRFKIIDNKEVVTIVKTDTLYVELPPKQKRQPIDSASVKSRVIDSQKDEHPESENSVYETEFYLEDVQDEVVADQLLQTKTVKVKMLSQSKPDTKLPDDIFQFFEIQQWSTPIKNKITYYRDKNMVKIKGMSIDYIEVVVWNDLYFLEAGNRYYAIPETKYFEKLNLIHIP
jgi:hypothetical protein